MRKVKKYAAGLFALGFALSASTPGHAFTSNGTKTVTASASIGGTATLTISNVAVLNLSNGQPSTSGGLAWSGVTAGYNNGQTGINSGWKVSDQYIQLTADINTASGGIQFYTDNTNSAAVPKFTGPNDGVGNDPTPAGLVDNVNTANKLPTAWMASTSTFVAADPKLVPIDPNFAAGNSFLWFYGEDAKQVANTNLNAAAFAPGASYVTVYAAPNTLLTGETIPVVGGGVHYAQGVNDGAQQFGPFTVGTSVTNIYAEANFSTALAGRTYSTNRMILEAFSL